MTTDPIRMNRPRLQHQTPLLRIALIAAIGAVLMLGWYYGPFGPEPHLTLDNRPRAADVQPRRFVLWELHADDTARVVELITRSTERGKTYQVNGQSLFPDSEVLSLQFIGGKLQSQHTVEEVWRGMTFLRTQYWLSVSGNRYGYDIRIARPPHLHINGGERLISLGIDPKFYAQEIIAVAIPRDARLRRIYDYQPYRHLTLNGWDVFYYDVSDIQSHVSIHISYRPGRDASPLDWTEVESNR